MAKICWGNGPDGDEVGLTLSSVEDLCRSMLRNYDKSFMDRIWMRATKRDFYSKKICVTILQSIVIYIYIFWRTPYLFYSSFYPTVISYPVHYHHSITISDIKFPYTHYTNFLSPKIGPLPPPPILYSTLLYCSSFFSFCPAPKLDI